MWHIVSRSAQEDALRVMRDRLASETERRWPLAVSSSAFRLGQGTPRPLRSRSPTNDELYPVLRTLTVVAGLDADAFRAVCYRRP